MSKEMDCSEVKNLMARYLAGELDEETRRRVEEHLHDCPDCRPDAELDDALGRLLNDGSTETPPDDYWDGYNDSIRSRLRGAVTLLWRIGYVPGCLGGVIAGFLVVLLIFNGSSLIWPTSGPTGWVWSAIVLTVIGLAIGLGMGLAIRRANRAIPTRYTRDELGLRLRIASNPVYRLVFMAANTVLGLAMSGYLALMHYRFVEHIPPALKYIAAGVIFVILGVGAIVYSYVYITAATPDPQQTNLGRRVTRYTRWLCILMAVAWLAPVVWDMRISDMTFAPSEAITEASDASGIGDLATATRLLERCIERYPDAPRVLSCYAELGSIYAKQSKMDQADQVYHEGIEAYKRLLSHPKFYYSTDDRDDLLNGAANLYAGIGDRRTALDLLKDRLLLALDDPRHLHRVALDCYLLDFKAEARGLLARIIREYPHSSEASMAREDIKRW